MLLLPHPAAGCGSRWLPSSSAHHPPRRVLLVGTAVGPRRRWCAGSGSIPRFFRQSGLARRGQPGHAVPGHHQPAVPLRLRLQPSGSCRRETGATRADSEEGFLFDNTPEALFTACLLGFLATMTLVTVSQHFGLLWVAIEATTLVSAPLIYYHRHHRSLEATWKYLLICSVGIAVALLGTYFLRLPSLRGGGVAPPSPSTS